VSAPVNRVAVLGSDSAAWIAASSLAKAFQHRKLDVTVVEHGIPAAPPGRWTLPSQRGIHALLGIAEPDFVNRTGATYKLASEHLGWQGEGSGFVHAHGEIGTPLGSIHFYKYLLREWLAGRADPPVNYSLAAAAAVSGRFARPMGKDRALTASFTYGFHIDEEAYASYLRAHAFKLGVKCAAAPFAGVDRDADGHALALRLSDGTALAADLFVDCTSDAPLMNAGAAARVDWSASLPCDRLLVARAPARTNPPAMLRTTAASAGWRWRMPLAQETLVGYTYASAFIGEDEARAELAAAEPQASVTLPAAHFSSGRRSILWDRNCVAVGSAAMQIEPLAGADLHAAQLGVSTLIELFPRDARGDVERIEYQRLMVEHLDSLRDFTLAHYIAGPARPGAFWGAVRAAPVPERLTHKLELFRANGRIELLDFESFEETDWAWLLLGTGCKPDALELAVVLYLEKFGSREAAPLRTHVRELAASMPPHLEYVRRLGELAARAPR
jgi:tryptophan 7-halogenase